MSHNAPAGRVLTSVRAPRVAAARRLAKRAFRAVDGAFLVEGPQPVREALADTRPLVRELFVTDDGAARHADLVATARRRNVAVYPVSGQVMSALAQTVTPQGVVAVTAVCDRTLTEVVDRRPQLVAVLCSVRDPGNAGTVLRTADAAGADAVVFADASVDPYNAKCVRASAGSLFHVPLVVGVPARDVVAALRRIGSVVLAADGSGPDDLDDLQDTGEMDRPTVWLFGNEAWGLPAETTALADRVVRVPIHGRAESLNLASAAAVCLYASARAQRRTRPTPSG